MKPKIYVILLILFFTNQLFATKIIRWEKVGQKETLKIGEDFNMVYGSINPENSKVIIESSENKNEYYLQIIPYTKSDRDFTSLYLKKIKSDSLVNFYRNEFDKIKAYLFVFENNLKKNNSKISNDTLIINKIKTSVNVNPFVKPDIPDMTQAEIKYNYSKNLKSLDRINNQILNNHNTIDENKSLIQKYRENLINLADISSNQDKRKRLIFMIDSLSNTNTYLAEQNELLNLDKKILEKDKKIFESEIRAQIKIRNYSIILAFLAIIFLIYYYINYRKKKKINILLNEQKAIIEAERKKSDDLLLNVLPHSIANRLKAGETPISDHFDEVSVVFIDIARFTDLSKDAQPERIVIVLNKIYTMFDKIAEKHKLEKIKTIGDCYMAVAGLPEPIDDHSASAANFAIEAMNTIHNYDTGDGTKLSFKIGIDCGPVVAGVIGEKKFIYDLWGDTVNTASRMEEYGIPGQIQVTDRFRNKFKSNNNNKVKPINSVLPFNFEERGELEIKGKGAMRTWFMQTK